MSAEPLVLVIEGEIGAGKTTLIAALEEDLARRGLRVAVVHEPVDAWSDVGILAEFYKERDCEELRGSVAYDFQTFTFVTRILALQAARAANPAADIFVLERSVLTDRFVFMELQREQVGKMRMAMYETWWGAWEALMAPLRPTHFVYLKPDIASCMSRVGARQRVGEIATADKADAQGGVSQSYQERLREAHEAYLEGKHAEKFALLPKRPFSLREDVLVVKGGLAAQDFSVPGAARDQIVKEILDGFVLASPS